MSSTSSLPFRLQGEVVLDVQAESFTGATMYVYLNDTTMLDEPAKKILEEVVTDVSYNSNIKNRLTFCMSGVLPKTDADYTVRVILDLDRDGRAGRGDYINSESYAVLSRGKPATVSIRVKQIR